MDRSMGPFLSAVFEKLRQFVSLSLKECLVVSSLVSRVLTYPSRPLFQLVSHITLETVAMISAEFELRMSAHEYSHDDMTTRIEKALVSLSNLRDIDLSEKMESDDEASLFQKLVVLDEFVRELVAIDSAKSVFEIENQL